MLHLLDNERAPPDRREEEMLNDLLEIERRLRTNDAEFYRASYAPDAVLIFPVIGKIDRRTAVEAIREENRKGFRWEEVAFDRVAALELTPDAVLLTYEATARWNYESVSSRVLCSTVYVRRERDWLVAFHQQTEA